METMFDLADKLKELKDKKKVLQNELKDLEAEIELTDYKLSEIMAENEMQNFTRSKVMFYLKTSTRASAVSGQKEKLYESLKNNGYGDLVYETVNANSLSAFVKEEITENADKLPDWLAGLVNVFEKTNVVIREK